MRATIIVPLAFILPCASFGADAFPSFKAKVIDPNVGKVCYAVTLADVDEVHCHWWPIVGHRYGAAKQDQSDAQNAPDNQSLLQPKAPS